MNVTDTSLAANEAIKPKAGAIRELIRAHVQHLKERGATCDEVERALDLKHQTASARICELKQLGKLYDTGVRRLTRSGSQAIVYRTP